MITIDGRTLRKIRIAYKLTQDEVAALCDVTASMINKIERNKYPMTQKVLRALNTEFALTAEKVDVLLSEYERIQERRTRARLVSGGGSTVST